MNDIAFSHAESILWFSAVMITTRLDLTLSRSKRRVRAVCEKLLIFQSSSLRSSCICCLSFPSGFLPIILISIKQVEGLVLFIQFFEEGCPASEILSALLEDESAHVVGGVGALLFEGAEGVAVEPFEGEFVGGEGEGGEGEGCASGSGFGGGAGGPEEGGEGEVEEEDGGEEQGPSDGESVLGGELLVEGGFADG